MDPFAELWGPPKAAGAGPLTMQLIKHFEGYTPKPKWDSKQYSVGYSTRWEPGTPVGTREDHEAALQREAGQAGGWLDRNVRTPLDDTKRAVLTSAGYNLGTGEKGLGSLLPDINAGDWPRVAERLRTFNKSDGAVNPGLVSRRNIEADMLLGRAGPPMGGAAPATQERAPMPMMQPQPRQPGPLASAMGGMSNSMVPGIFGGGDEPGYFGKLLADPTFLMGASVLGSGLSGRDAGTALMQGAQGASAVSEMTEKRRRAAAWQKTFGGGSPDANSPMLKGVPPDLVPLIHAMGPEQGMALLGQIKMKQHTGKQIGVAAPGSSFYDLDSGKVLGQAPTESPYNKELAQEQAKADVKTGEHIKAGQQMLDLTGHIRQIAGEAGTPARQTFEDATGPLQGTDWYQTAKGFINSKAETPVVSNALKQGMGTINLLATRAYLSGQGQVTESERASVKEATGRVLSAPSGEAALAALDNLDQIVKQVFMKPPTGQPGAPTAPGGVAPPQMPQDVAAPGLSVQGGVPGVQPAPQAAPPQGGPVSQPGGNSPTLISDGKGNMLQLDPTGSQWVPVQQPQAAPAGQPAPAAAAAAPGPVDKGAFSAPRPNGPNILDRWVLKAGAARKPELIQQYNAAFGPGEAEKVLGIRAPQPAQRSNPSQFITLPMIR